MYKSIPLFLLNKRYKPVFKYNANAKYSSKDLKDGHNNINFSLLDIYLNEKGPFVKTQLLNIFKDHHIVAQTGTTEVGYDKWQLSNAICMKFYNSHGKYKPEIFCTTSALGTSWQHLNHPNLLVRSV